MFFGVKELELHKIRFATALAPGEIEFFDPKLKQKTPLEVTGTAEVRISLREIRVHGHLSGTMECECDRCLEATELPLDGDFDLCYQPVRSDWGTDEIEVDDEASEVGFYQGGGIELADVVREQILLWLPMQRVCRADCKGICPTCGQNRNEADCGCRVELIDERWAALRNL